MFILSQLELQLIQIEKFLNKDLKDKLVTYNFLVCEDEKFLDAVSLEKYLTEQRIEKFTLLKTIYKKCENIVEIWNNKMDGMPNRVFNEPLNTLTLNGGFSHHTLDFHAIYVLKDRFEIFTRKESKEEFVKNYKYKIIPINKIALICLDMSNFIIGTYPNLKTQSQNDNFESISIQDFKSKYKRDSWVKYEKESNELKSSNLKIQYWNDKKKQYLKDKIRLNFANVFLLDAEFKEPKQLTGFSFDTFCEKKIQLLNLENDSREYISDAQKREIDKKYFPNGFPYVITTFKPESYSNSKRFYKPFESLQEYEKVVKSLRHRNGLSFFHFIKNMNEADFIKEINNQYLDYTLENTENAEYWLKLTYDLVLKGFSVAGKIEDVNLRGAFINWHNEKIKSIDIKQPQQTETQRPDEVLLKNKNIDIFKNDLGFTIFMKMYNLYKDEKNKLANFSFLFYAMEKEFLVCNQSKFKEFLEKQDIFIDKIDSRQSGTNSKSKLYNSIKESVQKWHDKSTI